MPYNSITSQLYLQHFLRTINSLYCKFRANAIRFFFASRRRLTRWTGDWSSDVCSSDLRVAVGEVGGVVEPVGRALLQRESLVLARCGNFQNQMVSLPDAQHVRRRKLVRGPDVRCRRKKRKRGRGKIAFLDQRAVALFQTNFQRIAATDTSDADADAANLPVRA